MASSKMAAIPSFKDFVRRSQVLGMYRSFLREVGHLDGTQKQEIRKQVIEQFRSSQSEKDSVAIKRYLADGRRQLDLLQTMTLSYKNPGKEDIAKFSQKSVTCDPNETQGRVGTEWPWKRK